MTRMTTRAVILIAVCALPASAAPAVSQTLEALRSAAVDAPGSSGTQESAAAQAGSFFDASSAGIKEVRFTDHVPAAGVHVHSPKGSDSASAPATGSDARTAGTLAVGGGGLLVAALLLGGAAAGPLGIAGGLLLVAALTVFLSSR